MWDIPKPDLIIGGSPCQGFSFAGNQLAFNDPRSKLFFTMMDIIDHYKPQYRMLENVRMKQQFLDIISDRFGCQPILINSSLVSAQNRQRYYWCNWSVPMPKDKGVMLKDIIDGGDFFTDKSQTVLATIYKENAKSMIKRNKKGLLVRDKSKTLRVGGRSSPAGSKQEWDNVYQKPIDGMPWRKLSVVECERLQTLPDNYTEGVSNTQRYKMLGNGWTVDVIRHLFEHMD